MTSARSNTWKAGKSWSARFGRYRPELVALIGVTLYRAILPLLGSPRPLPKNHPVELGAQSERIHGARIFVLPNPSGRNANFTYAEMLEAFRMLESGICGVRKGADGFGIRIRSLRAANRRATSAKR